MLLPLLLLGSLGVIFGIILVVAEHTFRVEEDPRLKEILSLLPGANCGACGFPSCEACARQIVEGKAPVNSCVMGGEEVTEKICRVMGVSMEKVERKVAVINCNVDNLTRKIQADYQGIQTCQAAHLVMGGGMSCAYGCLGFGDCMEVCPVEAISLKDGLPRIDREKCIGCGRCVEVCPRKVIELIPRHKPLVWVACSNPEPGKKVREVCKKGCIACKVCEKLSGGLFEVSDFLSRLKYEEISHKEVDWEKLVEKCPTGCILKED